VRRAERLPRGPPAPDGGYMNLNDSENDLLARYQYWYSDEKKAEMAKVDAQIENAINGIGKWNFFISYTQRHGKAETLANVIYSGMKEEFGLTGWLDVKMDQCDSAAMREGVLNSTYVIAVISGGDVKENRYFERSACQAELKWAIESGKPIVPVVDGLEKLMIGEYIKEGKAKGIDLSDCNFVDFNKSHPAMIKGSLNMLRTVLESQKKKGTSAKMCEVEKPRSGRKAKKCVIC